METESIFQNTVLKYKEYSVLDKNRMMASVQKHNICTNVPSSQNFRSYLLHVILDGYYIMKEQTGR
jgi:hypothetical protein